MGFTVKKRRQAFRAPLNRPVQIKHGSAELPGRGIEVGIGGMSLWVNESLPKNGMVTVMFNLPASARQIVAMSEVVWSNPPIDGSRSGKIGVRFVALPREQREEIRAFVNRQAKHYRDLHMLLAMNEWKMEKLRELTAQAHLDAYRDIKDLKDRVRKAMDGFRL
jgi:c-di-GMP-binding flagellar brake protein YcgR